MAATEFDTWLSGQSRTVTLRRGLGLASQVAPDFALREEAVQRFSWGCLTAETVQALLPFGPFLEVGAGSGYWAHELAKAGADIIATDAEPYTHVRGGIVLRKWAEVRCMTGVQAVRNTPDVRDRTLLIVWPTLAESWAAKALQAFEKAGGSRLVYVGEGAGGCCADDEFFEVLGAKWSREDSLPYSSWDSFLSDDAGLYRRGRGAWSR